MNEASKKICLVASSGGHIEELMQLKALRERYSYFLMVPRTKWTENIEGKKYFIKDINRKNKLVKALTFVGIFIQQIPIFLKERPDIVVTTGAVVAVPVCIYAKLFHKKVIFIESIARVTTRSQTGQILEKIADLFLVQWKEQLICYPDAVYGGWIY